MRDFATTVWNLPSHVPGSCPQRRTLRGESPNRVEWPQDYALLAMWGPRWIAKLVNITPITMIYGTYNNLITIVNGVNLNQLITGGPHIVTMGKQHERWRFSWEGLWIGLKCVQKKRRILWSRSQIIATKWCCECMLTFNRSCITWILQYLRMLILTYIRTYIHIISWHEHWHVVWRILWQMPKHACSLTCSLANAQTSSL